MQIGMIDLGRMGPDMARPAASAVWPSKSPRSLEQGSSLRWTGLCDSRHTSGRGNPR